MGTGQNGSNAVMISIRTITMFIISATLTEVSTHETFMKRAIELAAQTSIVDMAGGPLVASS